jgi:hypothetical protein
MITTQEVSLLSHRYRFSVVILLFQSLFDSTDDSTVAHSSIATRRARSTTTARILRWRGGKGYGKQESARESASRGEIW